MIQEKKSLFIALTILVAVGAFIGYLMLSQPKPQEAEEPQLIKDPEIIEATASVEITDNGFVPETIKVKPNTVITWTNNSKNPHHVASDPYPTNDGLKGFDSQDPLLDGESFSFNFTKIGTYAYHNNLSPYTTKGVVIVE